MKKMLKKEVIIAFVLGAVIMGSIAYATSASQVPYTTDKNGAVENVSDALNDLYSKATNGTVPTSSSTLYAHTQGNGSGTRTASLAVPKGKYIVSVFYVHGGASSTNDNLNTNETMNGNLTAQNNNCTITQLKGYHDVYRSTKNVTDALRALVNSFFGTYYVEVSNNGDTLQFASISNSLSDKWAQTIDMYAVPIN